MGNRIITCSDGTWNKPIVDDNKKKDNTGKHRHPNISTNVERIFNCIAEKEEVKDEKGNVIETIYQHKAYDQGVGTGVTWWDRYIGGATGLGLDRNIKDMYLFLCMAYRPGDDIYLFGFSRGAYTARSLAGFIYNCSILEPSHINLVDTAYDLYRNRNPLTKPNSALMRSFRDNYCYPRPKIKFIGVWDTVGSLGLPIKKFRNPAKYRFHDCTLNDEVQHAYHALAIDEQRTLFSPTLWQMSKEAIAANNQTLEQRWFPGVHSNVGGGYPDHGLSDIALKWLMEKAQATGLQFDPGSLDSLDPKLNPNSAGKKYASHLALPYLLTPWDWGRRKIREQSNTFETIDDSVLNIKNYNPRNAAKLIKELKEKREKEKAAQAAAVTEPA